MSVDCRINLILIYLIYMGAALGCSCETKDDQAEISLVQQPIANNDSKKQQMRGAGGGMDDSSDINDGSVIGNANQVESMPKQEEN
jgi:hypothetical protein